MQLAEFLGVVITADSGWFCLAHAKIEADDKATQRTWKEEFFSWPDELPNIINRVRQLGKDINIYFSPYLFSEKCSQKKYVLPSRTIVADLDDANVLTLALRPTILVESSTDRHQGYWILNNELGVEDHEALSKRMTYSIPRCDRTGWFAGKKVRVPETMNTKYVSGPQYVRIADVSSIIYSVEDIEHLPTERELFDGAIIDDDENIDWVGDALSIDIGPQEMLASLRSALPARVIAQYNTLSSDRSAALWALMSGCFRAGLKRNQVFHLAYHSVNNKFKDLRYGGTTALAKDVLRCELALKIKLPDAKNQIREARRLSASQSEKSTYIAKLVIEHLNKIGSFVHTTDDNLWYIREDTGRPVQISVRSDQLSYLIDSVFGINGSEKEASYIYRALATHANDMPMMGQVAALSHYTADGDTFLIHSGRKDVLKVSRQSIEKVSNGYNSIIFPWVAGGSIISPKYKMLDRSWDDELFDGCFDNILEISAAQAQAILKVWLITLLMRDGVVARPILALFGAPGSGKSTLYRRIYALLYGKDRAISGVTDEDKFDIAVSTNPLVVLDNVDTWAKWLPDRLALSASSSDIIKRKLFTDMDTVTMKRQAMIGLSAHNPKFGREDVTDRLLIFTFERIQKFKPETDIINRVHTMRNSLWGAILNDIQRVFNTPKPADGWPQFRIEDFARFGYWIATAVGCADEFYGGIDSIRRSQKIFNLEEDGILLDALRKWVTTHPEKAKQPHTPGQLWTILGLASSDEAIFQRQYKNAVGLGKKFWSLQDSLKEIFKITWKYDTYRGARTWSFEMKNALVSTNGVHINGTA